jgi:hypothetical protein
LPPYLPIIGFAFLSWLGASVNISFLEKKKLSRRITQQYLGEIFFFGIFFALYFQYFESQEVLMTILVALFSLLAFELIAWKFYYKRIPWYYGFVHWWLPSYVVAAAIYGAHTLIIG